MRSFVTILAAVIVAILIYGGFFWSTGSPVPVVTVPAPVQPAVQPEPALAEKPKPPDHFTLNIASAFNAFIGENWKRENHDDDGIPADGRIVVPSVVPHAFFQFVLPDTPNAIEFSAGSSATVAIPQDRRGHYGRLAVLHGTSKSPCIVRATLHYDSGADSIEELRVQDWNHRDEPKEIYVHKALQAGKIQLYSQILKLDPARVLESVVFQSDSNACIFALTAIVSSDQPFDGGK